MIALKDADKLSESLRRKNAISAVRLAGRYFHAGNLKESIDLFDRSDPGAR